ncbi:MAG: hypothetical protein U9N59_00405 [Campylobacterota bacterium]|nr:hypothetical protein [Campylobacterota bacterium]
MKFSKIKSTDSIKSIIKSISDIDLDVEGLWGYDIDSSTIINSYGKFLAKDFESLLCSLRSHIQMSMTLSEEERYTSISANEILRDRITKNGKTYDKVTYMINATKELEFKNFIKEYKENHGDENFDLTEHFKQRENCKINIEEVYWFDITNL